MRGTLEKMVWVWIREAVERTWEIEESTLERILTEIQG
jgi:hypothetical protein